MYTVEIESEERPGTWFQVDDPIPFFPQAVITATGLAARYGVGDHLRVSRGSIPVLEVR